jgi:hypothetical protein
MDYVCEQHVPLTEIGVVVVDEINQARALFRSTTLHLEGAMASPDQHPEPLQFINLLRLKAGEEHDKGKSMRSICKGMQKTVIWRHNKLKKL